jgi:hypothetical protein
MSTRFDEHIASRPYQTDMIQGHWVGHQNESIFMHISQLMLIISITCNLVKAKNKIIVYLLWKNKVKQDILFEFYFFNEKFIIQGFNEKDMFSNVLYYRYNNKHKLVYLMDWKSNNLVNSSEYKMLNKKKKKMNI